MTESSSTIKYFVLDTSVLLYDADCFKSFRENEVVIPYVVLEELDRFKSRDDIVGRNARQVSRELNMLRTSGHLSNGVIINNFGGYLKVELNFHEITSVCLKPDKADDRILNVCLGLMSQGKDVVLITKDINLAVRADVLDIAAEDFNSDQFVKSTSDIYSGTTSVVVPDRLIDNFYAGDPLYKEDLLIEMFPNQYITLIGETAGSKTALAKFNEGGKPLVKVKKISDVWGISPKNREQQFALDALMDPKITLVTLTGIAGCGKTLCSLAAALTQVQDTNIYDHLVVSRPVQPMGRDIGFLPGSLEEKMDPWMGPIKDAIEFLTSGKRPNRNAYQEMINMGMLEVEALTYIRGRSIPKTFILIDESQDLTRAELKTIISRAGEGSKIVLVGDVMQVTNPYLNSINNGLTAVIEKFKSYKFAAHISLTKGERSELASVAAEIL